MENQVVFYNEKLVYYTDSADLTEGIKEGKNIIIIDARKTIAYEEEHIPGAINFPHRDMNEDSVKTLDKNAEYVTYCDGIGCNASTKGAYNLAKLGFKVRELIGGLDWWKRDGYTTEGIKSNIKSDTICNC